MTTMMKQNKPALPLPFKSKAFSLCTILLLLLLACQELLFSSSSIVNDSTHKISHFVLDKRHQAVRTKTPEIIALETPCPKDEVPPFVTFAVFWIRGRWGRYGIPKAVRILYSSLSRTFNCAVELHVHTNYNRNPIKALLQNNVTTTMGTRMNGLQFHPLDRKAWKKNNPYLDPKLVETQKASSWKALSRSKLETMEQHMNDNPYFLPVWIDLDTVLLHPSAIMISSPQSQNHDRRPFIYGYQKHDTRNKCYGDIFALDQKAIDDIRKMEQNMIENHQLLPNLDLQGYFGLMLDQNASRLDVVQDVYPNQTFGFDCTQYSHPTVDLIKASIRKYQNVERSDIGGLSCKNPRSGKDNSKVGCLSFTSKTFREFFFLQEDEKYKHRKVISTNIFDVIQDQDAKSWLQEFLFGTSPIKI